jgi:hypothetical protein
VRRRPTRGIRGGEVQSRRLARREAQIIGFKDSAVVYVSPETSPHRKRFSPGHELGLRHALRVALGSIVGVVVVTFYGIPTAAQLSASAWAFVAGYAMEAEFATFDGIASKLK